MPSQPQNPIPLPSPSSPKDDHDRKPAIRTMKSDIEEMFRDTKPSLIKIVSREAERTGAQPGKKDLKKYHPFLYLAAGIGALIIIMGAAYWLLPAKEEIRTAPKLITPPPFFATETSRTISVNTDERAQFVRLLEDSALEREREGIVKRILIKVRSKTQERFATLTDFFSLLRITPPPDFLTQIEPPLMTFIYYGRDGSRLGLVSKMHDPDRALGAALFWEPSLLRDLRPLFLGETPETVLSLFEDRTYHNIDWRYLKLSQKKDLGLGYAVFPAHNLFLLATGKEAMETMISRLFEAQ